MRLPWRAVRLGWRGVASTLLPWFAPAAGALLAVGLFSRLSLPLDALRVELQVLPLRPGGIELRLPPLGSLFAPTHLWPVQAVATLENIDLDRLRDLIREEPAEATLASALGEGIRLAIRRYLGWLALLSAFGGVAGARLSGARGAGNLVRGAAIGALATGLLLLGGWMTRREEAWQHIEYRGVLQAAPWAVGLLQESFGRAREFEQEMASLAVNVERLFSRLDRLEPLGLVQADRTLLVISDLHNNLFALDLVRKVATAFRADAVLDLGDLTDWGTSFEAQAMQGLAALPIPYLFVPGNHDSPEVLEFLATLPNARILDGHVEGVGIGIVSVPDPSSARLSPGLPTPDEVAAQVEAIDRLLEEAEPSPTILAVHNPEAALPFVGRVPVILSGHTHRVSVEQRDGSLWLNPGSTGGAGIRGLQTAGEIPYGLALLYLTRSDGAGGEAGGEEGAPEGEAGGWRVKAVDTVQVRNLTGALELERRLWPFVQERPAEGENPMRR